MGIQTARVARATTLAFLTAAFAACGGSQADEAAANAPNATADARGSVPSGPAPAPTPSPAPSPSKAWRPFNDSSPWNTPIADNVALHANSAQLIDAFIKSTPWGERLDINMTNWSVPLYWAQANTPLLPVRAALGGEGWMGFPATINMPIPPGAMPDPQSDAHMVVIDEARTTEWGCFAMSYNAARSPAWQAELCATTDLRGSGVRTPEPLANPWYVAHGPRACGFPLSAGLIRTEEVKAGAIEHALVMAYPGLMARRFMSPASTGSAIGVAANAPGLPCGARVQLDPSLDVTQLGLSPAGVMVARALQKYGAYVGDYSGGLSLYAENSPEALAFWRSGVLAMDEFNGKLDLRRLRVVQYGQTYN